MMTRIRQFLILTGLTTAEAIRQPICLLLTLSCLVLTVLTPLLLMHSFGEEGKLARDSGLACHFVLGLFVAGYAACSSLSREMRSGTANAVLSKPVSRELFFLAKYAGVIGVILLFSTCATVATLLSDRVAERFHATEELFGYVTDWQTGVLLLLAPALALLAGALLNYVTRRPFQSTAFGLVLLSLLAVFVLAGCFDTTGRLAPFDFRVQWRILPASLLVTMALCVLAAIALALSTRLQTAPTLAICGAVFLLGLMSDYLLGRTAGTSRLAALAYRVVPNWQHFWVADGLNAGGTIPWAYVREAGQYGLVYALGIVCLGLVSFRHAEMR